MTVPSRRSLVIGGAAALLVAAVMMARGNDPAGSAAPPARRGAARAAAAAANMPVADVKLELLQQHRPELEEAERNLFRFQPRAAPPAPVDTRPRPSAAPAPAPPAIVAPTGPPPLPPIPLRFIGLVDAPTQAGRVAIFSDGRNNVFSGKDGDIIEGRYKVLKVSPDAAELSYVDGRGRQTIRLTGQ
jgi:hypothetical protein